ncbi:hypothetical protein H4582DRAFT_1357534 [Lactarius indigo]|nr:hypothetical protein H4582DRAFT_1357534 [Lactarius indigo]
MAGPCIQHTAFASLTLLHLISRLDSAHHWSIMVSARYTLATYVCYIQAKRLIAYAFLLLEVTLPSVRQSLPTVFFEIPLGRVANECAASGINPRQSGGYAPDVL